MLTEVMEFYGLERDFQAAGFFETEQHRQLMKAIRPALLSGKLVAVTGPVGSGKTLFLRRFEAALAQEGRFIVSRSLSVEKDRTTLTTLITALFYDLSGEKTPKIPSQGEERERALRELVRRGRKPVVLIVDEGHDLHPKTLVGLKRLMEVVADGGGTLSIVLAGHPKLRNDLRRPTMEEIGSRSAVFALDGVGEDRAAYIAWLLGACARQGHSAAGDDRRGGDRAACRTAAHAAADRAISDSGLRARLPQRRRPSPPGPDHAPARLATVDRRKPLLRRLQRAAAVRSAAARVVAEGQPDLPGDGGRPRAGRASGPANSSA